MRVVPLGRSSQGVCADCGAGQIVCGLSEVAVASAAIATQYILHLVHRFVSVGSVSFNAVWSLEVNYFLHRVPPTANPQIQCLGRCFFLKPGFESVCFWMFFDFLSKLCKGSELLQKGRQYESVLVSNLTCFWGVGSGQLFKHVSRTGIQIELRFVTTVFFVLFLPVFWTWNFRRHVFWTPRIGYAYNWNDPCVRFRQEATVDIHTHITSADTHTHITSADIHAHMLGHADAHLVIAGHHTCITACACTCACPPHIWSSLATTLAVAHCRHTCAHYICIHSC